MPHPKIMLARAWWLMRGKRPLSVPDPTLCGLLLCLVAMVVGCGRTGAVVGTVTLDQAPLADATVSFESLDEGSISVGVTDRQGRYRLERVATGKNRVRIETYSFQVDSSGQAAEQPERLPAAFHVDSQIVRHVTAGEQEIDLALRSDGSVDQ